MMDSPDAFYLIRKPVVRRVHRDVAYFSSAMACEWGSERQEWV